MKIHWSRVGTRVWVKLQKDDVFGQAAQLSYYALLAVFPLLLFLTALIGMLSSTSSDVFDNLLSYARQMLPYEAFKLVVSTLKEIQKGAGGGKLGFGIVGWLWASSTGMAAIMDGLNRAYEVREDRPWWKARAVAIGLTVLFSVFAITATVLVLYGSKAGEIITGYFGFESYFTDLWRILQWPVAALFLLAALALLYGYAPNRVRGGWRHLLVGALAGMLLWLAVSFLFREYLHFFPSYNLTYGSLGAVIVLLLWFYLSGAAILIGAEVGCELERGDRAFDEV